MIYKFRLKKLFLFCFLATSISLSLTPVALAASKEVNFKPSVEVPGGPEGKITGKSTGQFVIAIYNYALSIVAVVATMVLMMGGARWIMAMGNAEQIGRAKTMIGAALSGLLLAMVSWLIMSTISKQFVNFRDLDVKPVTIPKKSQ